MTVHDAARRIRPQVKVISCGRPRSSPPSRAVDRWSQRLLCKARTVISAANQMTLQTLAELGYEQVKLGAVLSREERKKLVPRCR